ncbi:nuclear pore complex protein [Cladophialophora carrionii]|uniref:Nuclear pore complex protein n=1 Tax=Cladophialophora carrionii TaxID=86049 RepID=A0A1C1CA33_9EURO|nr:nuclear pore complex protein [Cladophialophora carrionii]
MESLERLQGLHADLVAFSETRFANIDRLWQELEGSLQDFRRLLDKSTSAASDRDAYNNGKLSVADQEFAINDEFKHISRAIATTLDLDEIEAGRLVIQSQQDLTLAQDSLVMDVVSKFHNRRDLLLQCLRITLQYSLTLEPDNEVRRVFETTIGSVLDIDKGVPGNGSVFTRKCLSTLEEIERFQAKIADALQSKAVLGGPRGAEFYATLEFQRDSLFKQHEALACVLAYLFQGDFTNQEDLRKLHAVLPRWKSLDCNLIHYLPAFSAAFRQYGSSGSHISQESTASLNALFASLPQDASSTSIRPLQAMLSLWWTAEYSGQFRDLIDQDPGAGTRADAVKAALKEDALEFMLAICTSTNLDVWRHPARQELVTLLLSDTNRFALNEAEQTSSYFRLLFMECLENFIEAFISNMPDSIRKLRTEEDDQRLNLLTAMQEGLPSTHQSSVPSKLHLECFFILISFSFEGRPEAAELWWEDPDSNLYGFLQWASRRQTVPRVSAFCELLCSISEGRDCAEAAHKFLLDDSSQATTRGRRIPSMNYQQIFAELELYSQKVHERPATSQLPHTPKVLPTDMNELESPVMLSCYLRLLAHLSRQPSGTRQHILETVTPAFPQALLLLSSGPVPSYLRASVFSTLDALLTDKSAHTAAIMWQILDSWAAHSHDRTRSAAATTASPPKPTLLNLQNTLNSIASSFDQYDACVVFLRDLIVTLPSTGLGPDLLPFPKDLGSDYRRPGIGPYIDFVCGQVFAKRIPEVADELQRLIGSFHCLEFMAIGLEGVNEDYVAMLDRATSSHDALQEVPDALSYAQRSPFARLMQWLLSSDVHKLLLECLRVSGESADAALPDSPLLLSLQRSIDIINRVLDLQPTYFDIVRPLVQSQMPQDGPPTRSNIDALEEALAAHPGIVLNLCQFAATGHSELSIRALALLQKLSSSPKLNNHFLTTEDVRGRTRRVVDMLGPDPGFELQPVARNLYSRLQFDVRELEQGFESVSYLLKDGILAFFNACLETQPDLPNIAHLLIGFNRLGERLAISDSLDAGVSVFNSIANLVQNYPDDENGVMASWLIHMKAAAFRVLRHLWSSSLSSSVVVGQLRRLQFLQSLCLSQPIVTQQTLWDANSLLQQDFWYTTSAEALAEFLAFRGSLYNYVVTEIRAASKEGLSTNLRQILSTLQGKTSDVDGTVIINPDIFALLDFLDLDLSASFEVEPQYYADIDFKVYLTEATESQPSVYDVKMIREYLNAYRASIMQKQASATSSHKIDEQELIDEADYLIATIEARNRSAVVLKARSDALHEYAEMVIAVVECCPMEATMKVQFILHMIQVMLPKLDVFIVDERADMVELARAADALLFALSHTALTNTHLDNLVTEKLFQLFRASIEGIAASNSRTALRTIFYSICSQYLARLTSSTVASEVVLKARHNSMDCIRSASQRLVQVMCDDAEDGVDECRLNALGLLALLTSLARMEKSNLILDSLVKANMLEIMIDPLKHVALEFQDSEPGYRSSLLSTFEARMLLLLQISRTRDGAGALLDAGIVPAARDSQLFRADPDLGIPLPSSADNNNSPYVPDSATSALYTYYVLLSSTLRLLLSTFLSRGAQNEQIQYRARTFLIDYRPNMVGVFKKFAGVNGKVDEKIRPLIAESVRCYTGLITLSGFVELEDEAALEDTRLNGFS